ncbi:MAG: fumarate hydratase [Campylobacteraceae bacterium]
MSISANGKVMAEKVGNFIAIISKTMPDDILKNLKELANDETKPLAKEIYSCMFKNLERAETLNRPSCQDTGVLQIYVRVGAKFPLLGELKEILKEATIIGTKKAPLRLNAVEAFDELNQAQTLEQRYHTLILI